MVTIEEHELRDVGHAIRKIARKIVTARELIDEVQEEFNTLCELANRKQEELNVRKDRTIPTG